jgi:hypothetical protein
VVARDRGERGFQFSKSPRDKSSQGKSTGQSTRNSNPCSLSEKTSKRAEEQGALGGCQLRKKYSRERCLCQARERHSRCACGVRRLVYRQPHLRTSTFSDSNLCRRNSYGQLRTDYNTVLPADTAQYQIRTPYILPAYLSITMAKDSTIEETKQTLVQRFRAWGGMWPSKNHHRPIGELEILEGSS